MTFPDSVELLARGPDENSSAPRRVRCFCGQIHRFTTEWDRYVVCCTTCVCGNVWVFNVYPSSPPVVRAHLRWTGHPPSDERDNGWRLTRPAQPVAEITCVCGQRHQVRPVRWDPQLPDNEILTELCCHECACRQGGRWQTSTAYTELKADLLTEGHAPLKPVPYAGKILSLATDWQSGTMACSCGILHHYRMGFDDYEGCCTQCACGARWSNIRVVRAALRYLNHPPCHEKDTVDKRIEQCDHTIARRLHTRRPGLVEIIDVGLPQMIVNSVRTIIEQCGQCTQWVPVTPSKDKKQWYQEVLNCVRTPITEECPPETDEATSLRSTPPPAAEGNS